ncbi:MAG: GNAT family N-acetyltransferase [Elainellaceae cyanobacterium]
MNQQYRGYVIRSWQPSDRQAVSNLVETVLDEYGMQFEPDGSDRDAIQVETCYWQTGGEFWVAERDGKVIGSGAYHPTYRAEHGVELRKMFILPGDRGNGLGRYLLRHLEHSAATKGFAEMWLETATILRSAVALYERSGYQRSTGVDTKRCDRVYYKMLPVAKPNRLPLAS